MVQATAAPSLVLPLHAQDNIALLRVGSGGLEPATAFTEQGTPLHCLCRQQWH